MSAFHFLLQGVTDIGDSASLLAIALAAGIYLFSRGSGRAALALSVSFGLAAFLIGLLKVAFLGCHAHLGHLDVHSPSGHAANSTAVFLMLSYLMRSQLESRRRLFPRLLLWLLIAAIAATRVGLGYHTAEEVLIGLLVGLLAFYLTRFLVLRGRSPGRFDAYAMALWAIIAAFLLHGTHFPGEAVVRSFSSHIARYLPYCGG